MQETLITIMEISGTGEAEDRIAPLEIKVRDMDALVRGLLAELLDLKTVITAISRQAEERPGQDSGQVVAVPSGSPPDTVTTDGSTVIRPKESQRQDLPADRPEPQMVRIMQADGTMKMEPRHGT